MNAWETYSTSKGLLATLNSMSAFRASYAFSTMAMFFFAMAFDTSLFFLSVAVLLTIAGEHLTLY